MSVQTLSSNGELNAQGVLASNLNNTPPLVGFPQSSTGLSQGMYQHLGIAGDGTLITNFLNASADKVGGYSFYTVNSTTAPQRLLTMGLNGLETSKDFNIVNNSIGASNSLSSNSFTIRDLTNSYVNRQVPAQILLNCDTTHANITLQNGDYPYNQITDKDSNNSKITSSTIVLNSNYYQGNPLWITNISNNNIQLLDNDQGLSNNIGPTSIIIDDGGNTMSIGTTQIFINATDTNINSRLTSTDLLFNGVSTNTKISTNTSNIASNTTAINNINSHLAQIVVPQLTFSSPAIYADSSIIPSTNSTYQNTYGVFGWYMKNVNAGSKFNLYFPPQPNMTVADLKGVYYEMFSNCVNLGDMPYITIYTKPLGPSANPPDYKSWYHSSYSVVPSVLPSANSFVQCFGNLQNLSFNSANVWGNYSYSPLIASTYQNPKGDYQPNQQVLFVSLSSNSASAVGNLDCSLLKFGMISTFSNEYLLM